MSKVCVKSVGIPFRAVGDTVFVLRALLCLAINPPVGGLAGPRNTLVERTDENWGPDMKIEIVADSLRLSGPKFQAQSANGNSELWFLT